MLGPLLEQEVSDGVGVMKERTLNNPHLLLDCPYGHATQKSSGRKAMRSSSTDLKAVSSICHRLTKRSIEPRDLVSALRYTHDHYLSLEAPLVWK